MTVQTQSHHGVCMANQGKGEKPASMMVVIHPAVLGPVVLVTVGGVDNGPVANV